MKMPRFAVASIFNATTPPLSTRAKRRVRHLPLSASSCALTVVFTLGVCGFAQAQTIVRSADLFISMIGSPDAHAVRLGTNEGDILEANYEMDFNAGFAATAWESATWFSTSGSRVSAAMTGTSDFLEPIQDRGLTINNLTVENVDLDMGTVQLMLHPPTASPNAPIAITLNNGSLGGGLRTPSLWTPSPFLFNVTGDSRIDGWDYALRSVTTLNVATGSTLRIKDCGSVTGTTLTNKLYFSQLNNTAAINGGSLIIDNSAVVFGQNPLSLDTNQSTMTFSNNATLRIQGPNTTPKLETDRIVLQNSTLSMADNTALKLRSFLELDNSAAVIGDGGQVAAFQVFTKGNSTATIEHITGGGPSDMGITTDFLRVNDGATFNLAGTGDMAVTGAVYFPSSGLGTIRVTQDANLWLQNANINLGSRGSLSTERTATTRSQVNLSGSSMTLHQAGTFVNNGSFSLTESTEINVIGQATIGGTGLTDMDGRLFFAVGAPSEQGKSSLTTDNMMGFGMNSVLTLTIDPTARINDFITLNGTLSISLLAQLQLAVIHDEVLPFDIKFKLIDYSESQVPLGLFDHFLDLPDGAVFTKGLNSFRIDYSDENYAAGNSNVITLTTVIPEPSAALLTLLGAAALITRRRTPRAVN
jgi:hypothetical protein